MSNLLFASDHHFHHKKLIEGGFSPNGGEHEKNTSRPFSTVEEHDEALIVNHNKVVRPQDSVWFGGDVFLSAGDGKPFNYDLLDRMNGTKRLILGNHDTASKIENYKRYFAKILAYHEIGKSIILSHVPVHPSQLEHRFKFNIHGHVHSNTLDDPRYFNISMEAIDYTPISLEQIKDVMRDRGVI